MAPMASQPAMSGPKITIGRAPRNFRRETLLLWIPASVVGAAVGAMVAFEIRSAGASMNSNAAQEALRYVATIASAGLAAAAQWWVLQRARVDAYWWLPGTVAAQLLASILVIPSALNLFIPVSPFSPFHPSLAQVMIASGAALAAGDLVVGGAQALILRASVGRVAWLWVPATVVGGALAGAATTGLSSHLLALTPLVAVSLAAATGSLLVAVCQLAVLPRLLR